MPSIPASSLSQLWPTGQNGGGKTFPFGGIISGATIGTVTYTAGTDTIVIPVNSGVIKVDAQRFSIGTTNLSFVASPNGTFVNRVYVTPVRKVLAYTSVPTSVQGSNGDIAVHVSSATDAMEGDYQQVIRFYRKTSGAWNVYDATFEPPVYPGYLGLPMNEISSAAYSLSPELPIWHKRGGSFHAVGPTPARFRPEASFAIADVTTVIASDALDSFSVAYLGPNEPGSGNMNIIF